MSQCPEKYPFVARSGDNGVMCCMLEAGHGGVHTDVDGRWPRDEQYAVKLHAAAAKLIPYLTKHDQCDYVVDGDAWNARAAFLQAWADHDQGGPRDEQLTERGHVCAQSRSCICSQSALEPNENCPLHGCPWPPRCGECGRLMAWPKSDEQLTVAHASDCAAHNMPAYPNGPCDCGAQNSSFNTTTTKEK